MDQRFNSNIKSIPSVQINTSVQINYVSTNKLRYVNTQFGIVPLYYGIQKSITLGSIIQTDVPEEVKFSCVCNNYYTFNITSKQYGVRLSIFMQNPKGDTSSEMVLQKFYPSQR